MVWGWQIDDSWFAPRGDAGRDQKIKQNTEIKGWILWEEKRTVVEKGHNSSFIPLRKPAANVATTGGWQWRFRSDQWTHPEGQRTRREKKPSVISLSERLVFICVCTHRWQNVPQQKKKKKKKHNHISIELLESEGTRLRPLLCPESNWKWGWLNYLQAERNILERVSSDTEGGPRR